MATRPVTFSSVSDPSVNAFVTGEVLNKFSNVNFTFTPMTFLIADSGATKCEWCLVSPGKKITVLTQGMSPYFLGPPEMEKIIRDELLPSLGKRSPEAVFFYGTGCKDPANAKKVKAMLTSVFAKATVEVDHDLAGAAKSLCQHEKGVACILGTGSSYCYFNGKKIGAISPGLGYVLGDEGSGAYLGKMIIQYFLYETFEQDLMDKFEKTYGLTSADILENVYRKPFPNRYLASFTRFLSANRGHYMIENIIEDGLNDFFYRHIIRYPQSFKYPVHFTGGVSWFFKDTVADLCNAYGLEQGTISQKPMDGLIKYHLQKFR
jgi:glucosamine kinase